MARNVKHGVNLFALKSHEKLLIDLPSLKLVKVGEKVFVQTKISMVLFERHVH